MRRHLACALVLLSACSSYQHGRPLETVPLPAPPRERYEVWSHGKATQLHGLRLEGDSLVGVPWWNDPACDSCRVFIARAEVDSVRAREYDPDKTLTATVAGGAAAYVLYPMLVLFAYWFGAGNFD